MIGRVLCLPLVVLAVLNLQGAPAKPKNERESTAMSSSLPFGGPVLGVVTGDGGETLILASEEGADGHGKVQGWLLCTEGSSIPSWRKVAASDEKPRLEDKGFAHGIQIRLLPSSGLVALEDANGRLVILSSTSEPVALLRDTSGQPVWRRIDVDNKPISRVAASWFVSPLVVTLPNDHDKSSSR